MPHIIVEYAESSIPEADLDGILRTIHASVANSELFEIGHIRTRAYPFKAYTHASHDKPYMHIQARIKSGRDAESKKRLSGSILRAVSGLALPISVVTVEIIDMDRESYGKHAT